MDLMEHQAKEIFLQYGIPVPKGAVIHDESSLSDTLATVGADKFGIVKAQVLTGGRGKAGGIKVVDSIEQAARAVRTIRSTKIRGLTVEKVLIEERLDIKQEYFVSITIDPETSLPTLLISTEGGMDIEEIASESPASILKYPIDPQNGMIPFEIIELAKCFGIRHTLLGNLVEIACKLYQIFCDKEATLVEINPLVETTDGRLIAVDARLSIDNNALFRHPEFGQLKNEFREMLLRDKGIDFIDLVDGEVGLLCVGAGMTMLTMDLAAQLGSKAKCFIDISHGVNPEGFTVALGILSSEPSVRYIIVNMFGGLTRMDEIAESILQAVETIGGRFPKPMVLRLQGTNAEAGIAIMQQAGYEVCTELEELMARFKRMITKTK